MGMYDTFHAGDRHGQTKALGKSLAEYLPGDAAQIIPAPQDEESYEAYLAGAIAPVADSAQVVMMEGGFLTLRDGVLVGWFDERDESLPLYSYLGAPLERDELRDEYRERRLEEIARMREGTAPAHMQYLAEIFGTTPSAAELAALADEAEAELRGEPGDCTLCAAVRTGHVHELRASQEAQRAYYEALSAEVSAGLAAYDELDELPPPPAEDAELHTYSWRDEPEESDEPEEPEELSLRERLEAERRALSMRAAGLREDSSSPLTPSERFRLAALEAWHERRRTHEEELRTRAKERLGAEPPLWVPVPGAHLRLVPDSPPTPS